MNNTANKQNTVATPATMALFTFCPGLSFAVVSLLMNSVIPVRWSVAGTVYIMQLQSEETVNLLEPLIIKQLEPLINKQTNKSSFKA